MALTIETRDFRGEPSPTASLILAVQDIGQFFSTREERFAQTYYLGRLVGGELSYCRPQFFGDQLNGWTLYYEAPSGDQLDIVYLIDGYNANFYSELRLRPEEALYGYGAGYRPIVGPGPEALSDAELRANMLVDWLNHVCPLLAGGYIESFTSAAALSGYEGEWTVVYGMALPTFPIPATNPDPSVFSVIVPWYDGLQYVDPWEDLVSLETALIAIKTVLEEMRDRMDTTHIDGLGDSLKLLKSAGQNLADRVMLPDGMGGATAPSLVDSLDALWAKLSELRTDIRDEAGGELSLRSAIRDNAGGATLLSTVEAIETMIEKLSELRTDIRDEAGGELSLRSAIREGADVSLVQATGGGAGSDYTAVLTSISASLGDIRDRLSPDQENLYEAIESVMKSIDGLSFEVRDYHGNLIISGGK